MLALDEADRLLDMSFMPALRRVLPTLPRMRQTLLFRQRFLTPSCDCRPTSHAIRGAWTCRTNRRSRQRSRHPIHPVDHDRQRALLVHVLTQAPGNQALVLCKTKHRADVSGHLRSSRSARWRVSQPVVRSRSSAQVVCEAIHRNPRKNQHLHVFSSRPLLARSLLLPRERGPLFSGPRLERL
jgi:superfamily II DNA/RNA helicase